MHYLGHIISKDGVEADPAEVRKIKDMCPPKTVSELRTFLGLAQYYRKFIKGYSSLCSPLYSLLQKGSEFLWTENCQRAFGCIKQLLTSSPILAFPNLQRPFILTCDASSTAIGYILGQKDESGKEHVIEYGGRTLRDAERRYGISELECLATVEGVKEYKIYLSHNKFTIITDHQALKSLKSIKHTTGRLARWSLDLQGFDYEVIHRKGETNINADALSRLDLPPSEKFTAQALSSKTKINENQNVETVQADLKQQVQNNCQKENTIPVIAELSYHSDQLIANLTPNQAKSDENEKHAVMAEKQSNCPDFKHIFRYLLNKELPEDDKMAKRTVIEAEQYAMLDGVRYHMFQNRARKLPSEFTVIQQLALPRTERHEAMTAYHDQNGHFGQKKTYEALRAKYYWPGMYQETVNYVRSCDKCQKTKANHNSTTVPLCPLPITETFGRLHIDFVGPLVKTSQGHEH
ncbi:MAG: RNase H-like domain-containing protein [Candidatus Thiodiazotropha sp.]